MSGTIRFRAACDGEKRVIQEGTRSKTPREPEPFPAPDTPSRSPVSSSDDLPCRRGRGQNLSGTFLLHNEWAAPLYGAGTRLHTCQVHGYVLSPPSRLNACANRFHGLTPTAKRCRRFAAECPRADAPGNLLWKMLSPGSVVGWGQAASPRLRQVCQKMSAADLPL